MIKITYSESSGPLIKKEFPGGGDLIECLSMLLTKKLEGSSIYVHSFTGPMFLGKMTYNYLAGVDFPTEQLS